MATGGDHIFSDGMDLDSTLTQEPRQSNRKISLTEKGETFFLDNLENDRKRLGRILDKSEAMVGGPTVDPQDARLLHQELQTLICRLNSNAQRYNLPPLDEETQVRINSTQSRLIQASSISRKNTKSKLSRSTKASHTSRSSRASKVLQQEALANAKVLEMQLHLQRKTAERERQLETMKASASELERKKREMNKQKEDMDRLSEDMERKARELQRQIDEDKLTAKIQVENRKAELYGEMTDDEDSSSCSSRSCPNSRLGRRPCTYNEKSEILQVVNNALNVNRLPPLKPSVFKGDPMQYPDWEFQFESLVEREGVRPQDKIHYLNEYLDGDAKQLVFGYLKLRSENAYTRAREELKKRYGDPFLVTEVFRRKLDNWPEMNISQKSTIRAFSDLLRQCEVAMEEITDLKVLQDIREICKLSTKLPKQYYHAWNDKMAAIKLEQHRYPTFKEFSTFLYRKSEALNEVVLNHPDHKSSTKTAKPKSDKRYSYATSGPREKQRDRASNQSSKQNLQQAPARQIQGQERCLLCERDGHALKICRRFAKKSKEEKLDFIWKQKLCFGCLKTGHMSQQCNARLTCEVCKGRHPTCLHEDRKQEGNKHGGLESSQNTAGNSDKSDDQRSKPQKTGTCYNTASERQDLTSMILPVYVSTKEKPNQEILVYALLDTMSDTTFVTEECCEKLGAMATPTQLRLTTMSNQNVDIPCRRVDGLVIRGLKSSERISMPESYTKDYIPVNEDHIPEPSTVNNWPHLHSIRSLLSPKQHCQVGLLIGYNCPAALAPINSIVGENSQPFAVETKLGWSIVGGSRGMDRFDTLSHTFQVFQNSVQVGHCFKTTVRELNPSEILHRLERDFAESSSLTTQSQEDRKFLKEMTEGVRQRQDGYYELPLPVKNKDLEPPLNKNAAIHRALILKKKLLANPEYELLYKEFMDSIISAGEAEKVPLEEIDAGPCWYIPHHGVFHPKKPGKIRVVFDCSARKDGFCLNDNLLQGPDLLNSLVGVLCRFRQKPIAFTCDIQKMFHQFRVAKNHQNLLRFLWWEDNNLSQKLCDYRMKVHLFGATSSPGVANFALKKLAADYRHLGTKASDFLLSDFYVDDGLRSEETNEEAKEVLDQAKDICLKGNLRLHKFACNSEKVLRGIPEDERASPDESAIGENLERTLGLQWSTETDTFQFQLQTPNHPNTRRGILSLVASVYDPLGLIAPLVLSGKLISQALCEGKLKWDDPIPSNVEPQIENWKQELRKLATIKIPRCFRPANFGIPTSVQLHHFSDASQYAYGQCSYIRMENEAGQVHCSLVMAKARVAPIKPTTIPRLELQAAVLSTKIAKVLDKELDFKNLSHHFWTDSKVVLGYIQNEKTKFHIYVANRVSQIREFSSPSQWKYVSTSTNPADHASRSLKTSELGASNWFTGPEFLWEKEVPSSTITCTISPDDKEVKKNANTLHTHRSSQFSSFESRLKRFSNLSTAIAAFATIIRCCARKKGSFMSRLESQEKAQEQLVILSQREAFADVNLESKSNPLRNLSPFYDNQKILRVGGRLKRANDQFKVRHPAILSKNSYLSRLLALHFHTATAHQGRNFTINQLRSNGIWITGCRSIVSSVIHKCIKCIKLRGKTNIQQMSDLPKERLEPSPPFTHVGMDVFGPFIVKDGRKELKRYGLLFTCFALRAIHIEILDDLTTDSFINGFRCFQAIRGNVSTVFCDRGTNFIGAKNELNVEDVTKRLETFNCEFRFNPPSSSHMGGVWERQIRTIRNVFSGLLQGASGRLDSTSLRTLMYEVMSIVNSRPLTTDSLENPQDPIPLSPNNLLTMKPGASTSAPPGTFIKEDLYLQKRWRRVQYLANEFWTRWKREFLQNLQPRQKWQDKQENIQVGDIVILKDEGARSDWKLCRVEKTYPGEDGLVRKVQLLISTSQLNQYGKCHRARSYLDRPIHKLIFLLRP